MYDVVLEMKPKRGIHHVNVAYASQNAYYIQTSEGYCDDCAPQTIATSRVAQNSDVHWGFMGTTQSRCGADFRIIHLDCCAFSAIHTLYKCSTYSIINMFSVM